METTASSFESPAPVETERHWAAMAHLSALLLALMTSWAAGVAGVVAALVVWLLKKDASPFVAGHAREALNFNLSMLLYACAAVAIGIGLVGATVFTLGIGLILTLPAGVLLVLACGAIGALWLVCSVVAMVKAWNGESYRYPLSMRLVR